MMNANTAANPYLPFAAKISAVKPETESEFTLRVQASCDITPGQFFQVSLPRIGEAPKTQRRIEQTARMGGLFIAAMPL